MLPQPGIGKVRFGGYNIGVVSPIIRGKYTRAGSGRRTHPKCAGVHSATRTSGRPDKCPGVRGRLSRLCLLRRSACTFHRHDPESVFRRSGERAGSIDRIVCRETREKKAYSLRQRCQPLARTLRIAHFIRKFDATLGDFIFQHKTALHFIVTYGQVA